MTLSELNLTPLDVVFGIEAQAPDNTLSEIGQHALYSMQQRAGGFPEGSRLRIKVGRPDGSTPKDLTLSDVLEQARGVRRLLASARAADAMDMQLPERNTAPRVDLSDLTTRVVRTRKELSQPHTEHWRQLRRVVARNWTRRNCARPFFDFSQMGIAGAILRSTRVATRLHSAKRFCCRLPGC